MKERQHDFLHESFCNSDECSLFPVLSNRDVFEKLPWFCLESSDFELARMWVVRMAEASHENQ